MAGCLSKSRPTLREGSPPPSRRVVPSFTKHRGDLWRGRAMLRVASPSPSEGSGFPRSVRRLLLACSAPRLLQPRTGDQLMSRVEPKDERNDAKREAEPGRT